jgi:hypothetical protein
MSSTNRNTNDGGAPSITNNDLTLLMLQLRTLQQAKRSSTTPSHSTSTNQIDNVDKPPPVSKSSQMDIGRNISLLLQRRRQNQEQWGTNEHERMLRSDLVKLMEEALSISAGISMVVPNEPTNGTGISKHN